MWKHAEIRGSIRHAHAGGERIEEAGHDGELDPVHWFWGSSATDIYAAAWDDPGCGLLHSKGDGVWTHEQLPDRRLESVWSALVAARARTAKRPLRAADGRAQVS